MGGSKVTVVRYSQEFIRKIIGKVNQCHTHTLKNAILTAPIGNSRV